MAGLLALALAVLAGGGGPTVTSWTHVGHDRTALVVDGTVSAEKLTELRPVGAEYAELDFKRELDLA